MTRKMLKRNRRTSKMTRRTSTMTMRTSTIPRDCNNDQEDVDKTRRTSRRTGERLK